MDSFTRFFSPIFFIKQLLLVPLEIHILGSSNFIDFSRSYSNLQTSPWNFRHCEVVTLQCWKHWGVAICQVLENSAVLLTLQSRDSAMLEALGSPYMPSVRKLCGAFDTVKS